jgi:hypothetical protein
MFKRFITTTYILLFVTQYLNACVDELGSSLGSSSEVNYGVKFGFYKKYLWRGITYNDGFVSQPEIWVTYQSWTCGIWSNLTLHDINRWIKRNEIDFYLSRDFSIGNFEIENSFMYYVYPHQEDSPPTGEFYVVVGYPINDLKLTTNFTIDVIKYMGAYYLEPGIEYEKGLSETIKLSSSISFGIASKKFNDTYVGISAATLSILTENISITYFPIENFYISPHLQLNQIINKNLYEYLGRHANNFGLTFGMEF